jgi:demethylmenaquinone methyltransferase/2-methoxy-6-polyprenyl-1,4-benzoquinol methylase
VLPRLGQVVTGHGGSYRYLAESIRRFPDRSVFAGWIEDAGLAQVRTRTFAGGIATLYSAWRL